VQIGARPEDLRLGGPQEEGITAEVVLVEELGADAYIYARAGTPDTSSFDIVVRVAGRRPPATGRRPPVKGEQVNVVIAPEHTHVFSPITGDRL